MPFYSRPTYYDIHSRQGSALHRARRPYLVKNAITGLGAFAFCIGVYVYTLKAIGQDEFEDVEPAMPASKIAARVREGAAGQGGEK